MPTIYDILAGGESETIEFKTNFKLPVIEALVAFANSCGGSVYIGVNDDGLPVSGVKLGKETIANWMQ